MGSDHLDFAFLHNCLFDRLDLAPKSKRSNFNLDDFCNSFFVHDHLH